MKQIFLFILLFKLLIFNSYGQGNFLEGYIITLQQDTVYGYIKDENINKRMNNCTFRPLNATESVNYGSYEIMGYGFQEKGLYLSKPYISRDSTIAGRFFYEVIFDGYIRFLTLREEGKSTYFVEMGDLFYRLEQRQVTVWDPEAERNRTRINKEYLGYLMYLFQDVPELRRKIEKTTLSPQSLISLAANYHRLTGEEEPSYRIPYFSGHLKFSFMPVFGFKHSRLLHHHRDIETTRVSMVPSNHPFFGLRVEAQMPKSGNRPFFSFSYERFSGTMETIHMEHDVSTYNTFIFADYSKILSNIGITFPMQTFAYPSFIDFGLLFGHIYDDGIYQFFKQPPDQISNLVLDNYLAENQLGRFGIGAGAGYQYRRGIHSWVALGFGLEASILVVKSGDAIRYIMSAGAKFNIIIN